VATDQKSNEITAIPELLGMLDLSDATVSIDAGCQKKIAEAIVDAKADYVLILKDNQPTLHQQVRDFFESAQADGWRDRRHDEHETVDGEHGRIETRRVVVSEDNRMPPMLSHDGRDEPPPIAFRCSRARRLPCRTHEGVRPTRPVPDHAGMAAQMPRNTHHLAPALAVVTPVRGELADLSSRVNVATGRGAGCS
jgi:predicted transposase YbfD/YdcC